MYLPVGGIHRCLFCSTASVFYRLHMGWGTRRPQRVYLGVIEDWQPIGPSLNHRKHLLWKICEIFSPRAFATSLNSNHSVQRIPTSRYEGSHRQIRYRVKWLSNTLIQLRPGHSSFLQLKVRAQWLILLRHESHVYSEKNRSDQQIVHIR